MQEADGSCQKAVHSVYTGAYCKARQRLPVQIVR